MSYVCTEKRKLDVTIQEDSMICIIILHLLYQSAHLPKSSSSSVSQSPERMCFVLISQPQGERLDWSPSASPTTGKHLNGRPAAARLSFSSLYYYFKFQVILRKCSISNKHLLTKYNLWGSKKYKRTGHLNKTQKRKYRTWSHTAQYVLLQGLLHCNR